MFSGNDCSIHTRQIKNHEQRDCSTVNNLNSSKLVHPSETVLYHGATNNIQDNRMVWAALTPRGTQHFISENYPSDLVDYREPEDHYETIENLQPVLPPHPPYPSSYGTYKGLNLRLSREQASFDNHALLDYDYEEPTPLIESYQLENREVPYNAYLGNTDMRCSSLAMGNNTLRRGVAMGVPIRPRVSSPTRIEHPNLPPLNLYPSHKGGTLKKNVGYRTPDSMTLPKYGC